MLRKTPLVTVIPGSPEQPYRAASRTCTPLTGADPGDVVPDLPPWGGYDGGGGPGSGGLDGGGTVPPTGTPILLETPDGLGGVETVEATAPPPAGYTCRYGLVWVMLPGSTEPVSLYATVCSHPDLLP